MTKTIYLEASLDGHVELAAQMLRQGNLVAFATETVYGLGGLALNETSVRNIFVAKNRPSTNPLILHVSNKESAAQLFDFAGSQFGTQFFNNFNLLADLFWPGPLTLVGKKASFIPDIVTAGFPKVAVRIPAHPVALKLLQLVDMPVAAPSANLFTRPSPTMCKHVLRSLDGRVDAVLDGGTTDFGIESTVIDIDAERPRILRQGAVSQQDLDQVLLDLLHPMPHAAQTQDASPGMSVKHYSPMISEVLLADEKELAAAWFGKSGIVLRKSTEQKLASLLGQRPSTCGPIQILPDDPKGCAQKLYFAFYEMESIGLSRLLVENLLPLGQSSEWAAVCDRLIRAKT